MAYAPLFALWLPDSWLQSTQLLVGHLLTKILKGSVGPSCSSIVVMAFVH